MQVQKGVNPGFRLVDGGLGGYTKKVFCPH